LALSRKENLGYCESVRNLGQVLGNKTLEDSYVEHVFLKKRKIDAPHLV